MITIDDPAAFQRTRTATVARTLELARECLRAPDRVAPDTVSSELAQRLLPHLEADVRLAGAVPGSAATTLATELAGQRRELGRLVEELDGVVHAVQGPRRQTARTLQAVIGLLERHLATERELWAALASTVASEETLSALSRDVEATERTAARSLRFVWHPPVAPTAAKALWWTSPGTRRVVILDAAAAAEVRDRAGDRDGKEAP